ncbi:hypothetical protein QCN29_08565 [Streptomyces sp. HNM0663]|uniref:ATP-binding protein n=1 Tax=Streptomyces chengmaiensis TaxID=3040919 RepID=A0ABT6HLB8_9ACTN|nr:hypothetical protein [Streptomyces chengmaiensis]MDH2388839.1 hypothetical protein [Streptomyces chengmaiensis]
MPLADTEWDLVTMWAQQYLLDTPAPHAVLAEHGFSREFIGALPLTAVSADNARALVRHACRDIEGQLRLLEALAAHDRLSVLPEGAKAAAFRDRLAEDLRAHRSQDVFRTSVLSGGAEVFIDRQDLRETLRSFVSDPHRSVLLVDGAQDSGRSYTYTLIRHIGQHHGFRPARVTLSPTTTADQVIRRLAGFVSDPRAGLAPPHPTELNDLLPSLDDAVHWIVGRATAVDERYWLVLDECDKLDASSDVWDLISQLALAVYEHAAVRGDAAPRLVLLGYGPTMRQLPYDVRGSVCWDTARIVQPDDLRGFFDQYFNESPPSFVASGALRDASLGELVDEAVDEVLRAAEAEDGDGASYMRRICTAAEGAIRVYRSL